MYERRAECDNALSLRDALSLRLSTMCLAASPRSPGTVFHGGEHQTYECR